MSQHSSDKQTIQTAKDVLEGTSKKGTLAQLLPFLGTRLYRQRGVC